MQRIDIKTKLVCNISRLPIQKFGNPLEYIVDHIASSIDIDKSMELFFDKFSNIDSNMSLSELYSLSSKKLDKFKSSCIFHPWLHSKPVEGYKDVWVDIFRNKNRFKTSYKKLKNLYHSIETHGYVPKKFPDRQGGITGYFLSSEDTVVWYVVAGNHRTAVLRYLNKEFMPATFQSRSNLKKRDLVNTIMDNEYSGYFKRDYNSTDVRSWPSVLSGFLTEAEAIEILKRYVYGY